MLVTSVRSTEEEKIDLHLLMRVNHVVRTHQLGRGEFAKKHVLRVNHVVRTHQMGRRGIC